MRKKKERKKEKKRKDKRQKTKEKRKVSKTAGAYPRAAWCSAENPR